MASRAHSRLTSLVSQLSRSRGRSFATAAAGDAQRPYNKFSIKGDFAPVYVVLAMVGMAIMVGSQTAMKELAYSPSVSVNKKRRASIAEVEDPDRVVASGDKFVKKSWLRKVAHIQDDSTSVLPDPTRPNPFNMPARAETLKTAGIQSK